MRRFWHITLPWLRPMGLLVIILATINAVLAFDLFFLLTGGGPGSSTTVLSWLGYAYAFHFFKFGQGAATLYVLSILCLVLAYVYMRLLQGGPTGGRMHACPPPRTAWPARQPRVTRVRATDPPAARGDCYAARAAVAADGGSRSGASGCTWR